LPASTYSKIFPVEKARIGLIELLYKSGLFANWHTGRSQQYRSRQKTTFADARDGTQLWGFPLHPHRQTAAVGVGLSNPVAKEPVGACSHTMFGRNGIVERRDSAFYKSFAIRMPPDLISDALAYPKRCPITSVTTLKFPIGFESIFSKSSVKFRLRCRQK
jgi:hypothetical protein